MPLTLLPAPPRIQKAIYTSGMCFDSSPATQDSTLQSRLEQGNYFTWNLTKVFMVLMLVVQYYVRYIDF